MSSTGSGGFARVHPADPKYMRSWLLHRTLRARKDVGICFLYCRADLLNF